MDQGSKHDIRLRTLEPNLTQDLNKSDSNRMGADQYKVRNIGHNKI